MATIPFLVVVHPSVQASTLQEFINLARARPGKLNYASGGTGTTSHLAGEMFKSMAKVDIVHVPYKGVGPGVTDLLGGQVQMMFAIMQGAMPHVKAGKLKALAVSGAKRSASAPELPTISESGVPGYEFISWNAVHVPAGTPRAVVGAIHGEIVKVLAHARRERAYVRSRAGGDERNARGARGAGQIGHREVDEGDQGSGRQSRLKHWQAIEHES